jgi:hypothetical protein
MPSSRPARLLCVGNSGDHLETRCAVLGSAGYDARPAALPEAESLLRTSNFDLVIVSAWLSEWEEGRILTAAGKTPALVLTELTLAWELLAKVEGLLSPTALIFSASRRVEGPYLPAVTAERDNSHSFPADVSHAGS